MLKTVSSSQVIKQTMPSCPKTKWRALIYVITRCILSCIWMYACLYLGARHETEGPVSGDKIQTSAPVFGELSIV